MAGTDKLEIQQLQNSKKPFIPLRVYHRRKPPKVCQDLPEELVIEILKRLPVSSLLRFMCVCKSWYSLITNPSFISAHLSHQSDPTSKNGVTTLYSADFQFFLHNIDDPLDDWCKIDSPVGYMTLIVGSCDGLICLYDDWYRGIGPLILWNPSIRKAFTLPLPGPAPSFQRESGGLGDRDLLNISLGFGFDMISKDYKVVRVLSKWEMEKNVTYLHADVCSLSKGDWRIVGFCVGGAEFVIEQRGVHVNGVIHWMCKKKLANNVIAKTVLAFNLANEEFSQVLLPNPLSSAALFSVKLADVKLAVSSSDDGSNVWVMEEYGTAKSWKKLLDFHLGHNMGPVLGVSVGGNGKVVVTTSVGNWISWDPSNQKLRNLTLPLLEPDFVGAYVQSLVFLRFNDLALRCRRLPMKKKVGKRITAIKYRQTNEDWEEYKLLQVGVYDTNKVCSAGWRRNLFSVTAYCGCVTLRSQL